MADKTPDPTKSPDNLTASVGPAADLTKEEMLKLAQKLEATAATMDETLDALPACDLTDDERHVIAKLIKALNGYDPYRQRILGEITAEQADVLLNGAPK